MTIWHSAQNEEKPNGSVLLFCGSGSFTYMVSGFWDDDDQEWYDDDDGDIVYHVQDWSILPERPL